MKLISYEQFRKIIGSHGLSEKKVPLKKVLNSSCFKRIPYKFVEDHVPVGWSGKERCLYIRNDDKAMDVLHEFCHYLLCPEKRLQQDEFGLGSGFRRNPIETASDLDYFKRQEEEEAVCVLAYSFMIHLRMPKAIIRREIYDQNFESFDRDDLSVCRSFIHKRKDRINKRLGGTFLL